MQTKEEFSAGGVVFKKFQISNFKFQIKYLLGKHSGYHKWVLPKGLIEKGETSEETAVREIEEEMGIVAKVVKTEPIHTVSYTYKAEFKPELKAKNQKPDIKTEKLDNINPTTNYQLLTTESRRVEKYSEEGGKGALVKKTVTFYLMEWVSGEPEKDHGWEMEEAGWFEYEKCLEMMGFEGEKEALGKAGKLI